MQNYSRYIKVAQLTQKSQPFQKSSNMVWKLLLPILLVVVLASSDAMSGDIDEDVQVQNRGLVKQATNVASDVYAKFGVPLGSHIADAVGTGIDGPDYRRPYDRDPYYGYGYDDRIL